MDGALKTVAADAVVDEDAPDVELVAEEVSNVGSEKKLSSLLEKKS